VRSIEDVRLVSQSLDGLVMHEYELIDYIAEARHGHVFKAVHRTLGRLVAMTVLSEAAHRDPQLSCRFRLKAQALSRANHSGLLKAYDAGHHDNLSYLVTEFIEGNHLVELLKLNSVLTTEQVVNYVVQAADALHYLHERGVVHRNVKPSSLLLASDGTIRLVGIGDSLYQAGSPLVDSSLVATLQEPWPGGSLDYMAPEQIENSGSVDRRADIYSLGCTLFTLLTRRLVFPAQDAEAKRQAHRDRHPPSLVSIRQDVSSHLDVVFQKMLAKSPADRFASCADLVAALGDFGLSRT
jgi:serine/threonine-protein kinase